MEAQNAPLETLELHAIVIGQVQGVGFRATTRHWANTLGLSGIVRNLPDGTVEIYAQGSKTHLEKLLYMLRKESGGHVEDVTMRFFQPREKYEGFRIVY